MINTRATRFFGQETLVREVETQTHYQFSFSINILFKHMFRFTQLKQQRQQHLPHCSIT